MTGTGTRLTADQLLTLEAFADTVVPGCKRSPDDEAVAGVHHTPGAVEAGALAVLTHPATGIDDGVGEMADALNERAARLDAARTDARPLPAFVRLPYQDRRELVHSLTSPACEERELWFLLALFAYMAYDSAPHLDTAKARLDEHPGLVQLGFPKPDADGLWRGHSPTYGRPTARPRPGTDERGNLA